MICTIKWIFDYLEFGSKFPALITEVLEKILAILRLYNKRSTDLILGAEARAFNVITTINAKHLCYVSQCLSVVIQIIPAISHSLGTMMPGSPFTYTQRILLLPAILSVLQTKC
jgi:vacuolar protein sorting-associated protein 54